MAEQKESKIKLELNKLKDASAGMFKIEKRKQAGLVLGLTVILSLASIYFLALPVKGNYQEDLSTYENNKLKNDSLQKKKDILNGLAKDKETRAEYLKKVEDVLPKTPQVPEFLVALEKLASNNSLFITDFTPKIETKKVDDQSEEAQKQLKKNYNTVTINFDVSGNYINMKQFLKDLENNIRPINIISVSIKEGGQITGTSEEVLRFNVSGEIYYEQQAS